MGAKTNSQHTLIRVFIFSLLGTVAFGFGFLTTNNIRPAALEDRRVAPKETSPFPRPSKTWAAQTALVEAFENGDSFDIHYLGLTLTQRLEPADIVPLLHACSAFKGPDANIVRVIFALDLAYRNPPLLQKLLSDSEYIKTSHLDTGNLFYYWAQGDPHAAFELAKTLPYPSINDALLGIMRSNTPGISEQANTLRIRAANTKSIDHSATKKAIQGIADKSWKKDRSAFLQAFRSGFSHDPIQGLEKALEIDDLTTRQQAIEQLANANWSDPLRDLERILQLANARNIPNPQKRRQVIGGVIRSLDETNFDDALAQLELHFSPIERVNLLQQISPSFANGPLKLIESNFFQSIPDSPRKRDHLQSILAGYAHTDWQTALEKMNTYLAPRVVQSMLPNIVNQAFHSDGHQAATQLLEATSSPQNRSQAINSLANSWGRTDPLAFLNWTLSETDQTNIAQAQKAASRHWARSDLPSLRSFAEQLESSVLKDSLQSSIGLQIAAQSPIEAIEYASRMDDINAAAPIVAQAANTIAQTEPMVALDLLLNSIPDDPSTQNSLNSIARNWTRNDPQATAIYFNNLANDNHSQTGLSTAISIWLSQNTDEAIEFIRSMPAGQRRDNALSRSGAIWRLLQSDPQRAQDLLPLINDEELRKNIHIRLERIPASRG